MLSSGGTNYQHASLIEAKSPIYLIKALRTAKAETTRDYKTETKKKSVYMYIYKEKEKEKNKKNKKKIK